MWQKSRNWMARLGPAFIMGLIACSVTYGQEVRTNYRQGTDFAKYQTYAWVDEVKGAPAVGGHPDQILDNEIKQTIDSQLAAKGFTKVNSDKADFLVGYQIAVHEEKELNAYGMGGWGGWGWGPWGFGGADMVTATTSTINMGTLVLGIYDPAAKQLVWIGAATKSINASKNQEKNHKNLDKAMQKLLKDFPPVRK